MTIHNQLAQSNSLDSGNIDSDRVYLPLPPDSMLEESGLTDSEPLKPSNSRKLDSLDSGDVGERLSKILDYLDSGDRDYRLRASRAKRMLLTLIESEKKAFVRELINKLDPTEASIMTAKIKKALEE